DVARDRARARDRTGGDVGFDRRALLDGAAFFRRDLSANGALNDHLLVGRDLALDRDLCADDRARHYRPLLEEPPNPAGSSKSQSMRPAKSAPSSIAMPVAFKSPRTLELAPR